MDLSTGSQDQRFGRHSDGDTDGARARSGERCVGSRPYRVVGQKIVREKVDLGTHTLTHKPSRHTFRHVWDGAPEHTERARASK